MKEYSEELEPEITEKKLFNLRNILLVFVLGVVFIISIVVILAFFNLDLKNVLILFLITITIYAIILFFLLEPSILREIKSVTVRTIEKPFEVIKTVEKPVEVIKTVEKPVEKEVIKRVYIETPRKKLNIPKYEYVGSSETKIFHKRNCRLGKLIKRKNKISNNSADYFKSKGFKSCKICKPGKKK
jgi:hypothetical protein